MSESKITTLFLDIGGVLGTNGWDHGTRQRAAEHFGLDYKEMSDRSNLIFDTYEEGKLTLDEYLQTVVFHEKRSFSPQDFREFMFAQSRPDAQMIDLMRQMKARHRLKIAVVSNEGRELTLHRVEKFQLKEFVDFFVVSSFVGRRKPDPGMYRLALDLAQSAAADVAYIDDRAVLVDMARKLGIRGIRHTSCESTRAELAKLGLPL